MNLDGRLKDVIVDLGGICSVVSGSAHLDICYPMLANETQRLEDCRTLIEARALAYDKLKDLENQFQPSGVAATSTNQSSFRHARLLATIAYLGASWALADEIASWAGRTLCTPSAARNTLAPPHLPDFALDKKNPAPSPVTKTLKEQFGWAIGLGYALRNHFLHDGAPNFFLGDMVADRFAVNPDAWRRMRDYANEYDVSASMRRAGFNDPAAAPADLRDLLRDCECEIDEALGILLMSAVALLKAHSAAYLGQL